MMHLIKDGQPLADCPYCDEPLHLAPITTDFAGGMHINCYEKFEEDLEMIDVEKVYDGCGMDHPDADLIITSVGLSDRGKTCGGSGQGVNLLSLLATI